MYNRLRKHAIRLFMDREKSKRPAQLEIDIQT
jgi:hypothetical protein